MWSGAKAAADIVVIVGPGTAAAWTLPPLWDSTTDSCSATLKRSGVRHFASDKMLTLMEKLPGDTHHAKGSSRNARLFGLHLACVVWTMLDARDITESWAAQQFCHHDDDQPIYDKANRILFDDVTPELKAKVRPVTEDMSKMATGTMSQPSLGSKAQGWFAESKARSPSPSPIVENTDTGHSSSKEKQKSVRFVCEGSRSTTAGPVVLKSVAEAAAETEDQELEERRCLSSPVAEEDSDLDKLATKAVWRAVSEFTPPRTLTLPLGWQDRRVPSRRMLLLCVAPRHGGGSTGERWIDLDGDRHEVDARS